MDNQKLKALTNNNNFNFIEGEILLIDKPLTWTSFDVVNKIRYLLKRKLNVKKLKVGHAGTLDPLATGLLIVCTGKFTKKINEIQSQVKEYTGTITLGATTPSYDLETEDNNRFDWHNITENQVHEVAGTFLGESEQYPPVFSAKRINGQKAYIKARKGVEVVMSPQKITIEKFEIEKINLPHVNFKIVCSKGTYIRTIADDFGKRLNNGAHLSALCRTGIGDYKLSDAIRIEAFQELLEAVIRE